MFNINNEQQKQQFLEIMTALKKVNSDWIEIRQSGEYRIGMVWKKTISDLKKMKIKSILKNFNKWKMGLKKEIKYKDKNRQINVKQKTCYFSDERIAIYTSIFGNYDDILEPYFVPDNCDFFIFTDRDDIPETSVWKKIKTPKVIDNMSNIDKNRYIKMFPNKLFKDYKYSIYVDGNVQIITDLTEYIHYLKEDIGIGIHTHHLRSCVYDELKAVVKGHRITKAEAKKHKEYLEKTGMPKNYGLLQCNVIVRQHNNPKCIKVMNEWWKEFQNYSKRDQISLPHVLFMNDILISEVGVLGNNVYRNPSFRVLNHN